MSKHITTIEEYLSSLSDERKAAMIQIQQSIQKYIDTDFEAGIAYGMITYCIPHSKYPKGYHCNPEQALPYMSIASQKSHIAIYHMGLYASPELMKWFVDSYAKSNAPKLDMGKSCIRFKKTDNIPFELIGELAGKLSADEWIALYEKAFRSKA